MPTGLGADRAEGGGCDDAERGAHATPVGGRVGGKAAIAEMRTGPAETVGIGL